MSFFIWLNIALFIILKLMNTKVKNTISIVLGAVCLIGFFVLLTLVCNNYVFKIDRFLEVMSRHRPNALTSFVKIFTQLGTIYAMLVILLLVLIFVKDKKVGFCSGAGLLISCIAAVLFKYTVRRPRPAGFMIVEEIGFSFPSAHALLSITFYGLLIYFAIKCIKNKPLKIIISILLGLLIVFQGLSRIYLGVHYVSDIFAGYLLGGAVVAFVIFVYPYIFKLKFLQKFN